MHIGTNETLNGTFTGPLEQVEGAYQVVLRYRLPDGEGYWQEFIDKNNYNLGSIDIFVYDDTPVGPGPATGIGQTWMIPGAKAVFLMRIGTFDMYAVPVRERKQFIVKYLYLYNE